MVQIKHNDQTDNGDYGYSIRWMDSDGEYGTAVGERPSVGYCFLVGDTITQKVTKILTEHKDYVEFETDQGKYEVLYGS